MTLFKWTDRHNVVHELGSPASIELEVDALGSEIDRGLEGLARADQARRSELRLEIRKKVDRLQQLQKDCEAWNIFAVEQTRRQAAMLADSIDKLLHDIEPIRILAALHEERASIMAEPEAKMTRMQSLAIWKSSVVPKPSGDATRSEIDAWLMRDRAFNRPRTEDGGWFEWRDNDDTLHRLRSPLPIEYEAASIATKLECLLPSLAKEASYIDTVESIGSARVHADRLAILQVDLQRYSHELKMREDEEWAEFERTWRASRKTTS